MFKLVLVYFIFYFGGASGFWGSQAQWRTAVSTNPNRKYGWGQQQYPVQDFQMDRDYSRNFDETQPLPPFSTNGESNYENNYVSEEIEGKGLKKRRKYKKFLTKVMVPLLLAYKLKFFTLIPVMIGALILLAGATGLAGFFFALFAAVMSLKSDNH